MKLREVVLRRSRARRDMALSVGSGVGGQIALVASGIVSARALGVVDRGHLALIYLMSLAVSQLGSLGLPIAFTYFIASGADQTQRLAARFGRFIVGQFVLMTIVHAGILVALFWSSTTSVKVAAVISLATSGAQLAQQYGICVLQGLRRFRSFNILRLLGPGGYALLAGVAWAFGRRSLVDITIAFTLANVAAGVISIISVRDVIWPLDHAGRPDDPTLGSVVRFGLSGLLGASSPLETFRIDQSIVGLFLSSSALGIYVSAASFTNLPRFIAQSIGTVAYPYVAQHTEERRRRATMWRFIAVSALACAAVVVVLEITATWVVPLLFGNAFRAAIPVTRVLLIAGYVISLRRIIADASRGAGHPGAGSIAEVASWALLLPGLLFTVHLGLVAVGWSLTAGAAVSVVVLLLILRTKGRSIGALPGVAIVAFRAELSEADVPATSELAAHTGPGLDRRPKLGGRSWLWAGVRRRVRRSDKPRAPRRARLFLGGSDVHDRMVYLALVVAAMATGALAARAPEGVAVVLIGALIVVGVLRLAWKRIAGVTRLAGLPTVEMADDGRFRIPRLLLYGGLLTSCLLSLRFHGVTLSDALFLVGLLWAGIEASSYRDAHVGLLPEGLWLGILLFVAGGTISTIANSGDKLSSFVAILKVFYLIAAWFWLGGASLRTRDHIWTALKCWVLSAAVCGAWTVGQKFGHLPGGVDAGRYAGLTDHVNDLGALTACAIVPALSLAYRQRIWLIPAVGVAAGLVLSGSIGAGIAAVAALAIPLISRELARPTLVALMIGALVLFVASPLIGTSAVTRFSTSTSSSSQYGQDTFNTRIRTYAAAWHKVESTPLLGTGLDLSSARVYDPVSGQSFQVHNIFLGRLYDSGVLGCLGIIVLMVVLGRNGWRLILYSSDRYLALTIYAGFVAYFIDELSEPSLYKRYSLVPALLIIALRANVLRLRATGDVDVPAVVEGRGGGHSLARTERRPRRSPTARPRGEDHRLPVNYGASGGRLGASGGNRRNDTSITSGAKTPTQAGRGARNRILGGPEAERVGESIHAPVESTAVTATVKLNVGCGKTVPEGWVNIDKSPSVLLSPFPKLRGALRVAGVLAPEQAEGFPPGVVHANVVKRIPADDNSVDFVYSSHMIEHLSRWEGLCFVRECRRVLRPGGVLRLATPDLAVMVRDYLDGTSPFTVRAPTAADAFCAEYRAFSNAQVNFVKALVRKLVSGDSHQWLYDSLSIEALLREGGFAEVSQCSYREGMTPELESVEHRERGLFVEAM